MCQLSVNFNPYLAKFAQSLVLGQRSGIRLVGQRAIRPAKVIPFVLERSSLKTSLRAESGARGNNFRRTTLVAAKTTFGRASARILLIVSEYEPE